MPSPFVIPSNASTPSTTSGSGVAEPPTAASSAAWSAPGDGTEALRVSTELHERLALGAKMLQALDVQLRRFEGGLAEHDAAARRAEAVHREASTRLADLLDRSNQACDGFAGRLESLALNRLEQWERQLAETAQQAVLEVEQRCRERIAQFEANAGRVTELERRLADTESSVAEATTRFGEELKRQVEESNQRRDEAGTALRNASAEFLRLLEHADGVRRTLEDDLRQRSELLQRCRELDGQVRGGVEAMLGQLRESAESMKSQHDQLMPATREAAVLGERLERLLEAMQEWRPLLENDLPSHLHQRAEAVFEQGSRRFHEQLDRVSTAFNSLSSLLGGNWPAALGAASSEQQGVTPESPSPRDDEPRA